MSDELGHTSAADPRVTVVIPAYNAARTVAATVQSVLNQSVDDLEVLIVDDGSTDSTSSIIKALPDPRVRLVQQNNRGVAAARNVGVNEARGKYIAFLDSDDLWRHYKLERQLGFMDRERARATQTAVLYVNQDLQTLYTGPCPPYKDAFLETLLFRHLPAFPSTLVLERGLIDKIGFFDETLPILEDWEFAVRLARHGELHNVNEFLTLYRIHPGNRSRDLDLHLAPGFKVLDALFEDPELPDRIRVQRDRVYAAMFTMFSGGALRAGQYRECLRWALRAIRKHPSSLRRIAAMPARRIKRRIAKPTAS